MSFVSTKLLSMIVCGKNDAYQGNFLYRLSNCINFAACQLERLGRLDEVEFLVGDWASEVPLSEALPLTEAARKICKFVYVPSHVALKFRDDGGFCNPLALNCALRRATGEYQSIFDADSILPLYSLREIFVLIEGKSFLELEKEKSFFFFNRHHIPWEIIHKQPSIETLERMLMLHGDAWPVDPTGFGTGGSGAGVIAHRSMWETLRGYDENLLGAGWGDIELALRATQLYPMISLSGLGIHCFHQEHWSRNKRGQQFPNAVINPFQVCLDITPNRENWGLSDYNLEFQTSKKAFTGHDFAEIKRNPFPKEETEIRSVVKNDDNRKIVNDYAQAVQVLEERDAQLGKREMVPVEILHYLAWYSTHYIPATMYYYGAVFAHVLGIVMKTCCSTMIYTVNDWRESASSVWAPTSRLFSFYNFTEGKGYARHLTGDPRTALKRLKESKVDSTAFDIAIVNDFISTEDTVREISEVVPLLTSVSMLIVTSDHQEKLEQILAGASKHLSGLRRVGCDTAVLAIFLKD